MNQDKRWHSWVIRRNRYDNVISYIRDKVPEIDKYFYPLIKKEYPTKRGVRIQDMPLYEGYLFVRYNDHDQVFHKMGECSFVTTYAGRVTEEEINTMQEAQGKLYTEIKTSRFRPGETVILLEGPFKDFEAKVLSTDGDVITVRVDAHLLGKEGVNVTFLEDLVEHKAELQNIKVQDI